jgi:formylmethanofuran dehydrogenase subunit E
VGERKMRKTCENCGEDFEDYEVVDWDVIDIVCPECFEKWYVHNGKWDDDISYEIGMNG